MRKANNTNRQFPVRNIFRFGFCEAYLTALAWYSDLFCLHQELVRDLEQCFLCLYGHPSKKAKVCE